MKIKEIKNVARALQNVIFYNRHKEIPGSQVLEDIKKYESEGLKVSLEIATVKNINKIFNYYKKLFTDLISEGCCKAEARDIAIGDTIQKFPEFYQEEIEEIVGYNDDFLYVNRIFRFTCRDQQGFVHQEWTMYEI